jgi:hypothetical protein
MSDQIRKPSLCSEIRIVEFGGLYTAYGIVDGKKRKSDLTHRNDILSMIASWLYEKDEIPEFLFHEDNDIT